MTGNPAPSDTPQPAMTKLPCACPICDSTAFRFLSPVWRNYHREDEFRISEEEWFAECARCGTVLRLPLADYGEDFRQYGRDYYDVASVGSSLDQHAEAHFQHFQRPNYDSVHAFLQRALPAERHRAWLDVGSIGYATTFSDYRFTTIEPDERVVELGRRLFAGFKFWQRARIQCATLESFVTQARFDGILFNNSFYCVTTPGRTLQRARELLGNDGRVVVTISMYLNDAVNNRDDGLISRIEDVIPGSTLWVFYNEMSLRYLFARHGFELEKREEIPAYGLKTMQTYVFRRNDGIQPDPTWLDASHQHMSAKWADCFDEFERQSRTTLAGIDHDKTFLVGPLRILLELARIRQPEAMAGAIASDAVVAGVDSAGLRLIAWEQMRERILSEAGAGYQVVLCSFRQQDALRARLRQELGNDIRILGPNRRSGMDCMELPFGGQLRPIKGLTLIDLG